VDDLKQEGSMLVLNGTAEYTADDGERIKGRRYAFNMFSVLEDVGEAIEEIASFLGDLNWNEIDIKKTKLISNDSEIEDETLRDAFDYALENKFAVVTYSSPVDEILKF